MRLMTIVLATLVVGVPGASANEKLAFWDQQRKGANGGGGGDIDDWFRAATAAGIEYVRLAPATWKGEGRDFLLGDADAFDRIPERDLKALVAALDTAEHHGVKVVVTMFSLPGARNRQLNGYEFDYRLWNEEAYQEQAAAFWTELAGHLRSHPAVVAYNPLNEPHPARQHGHQRPTDDFAAWRRANEGGTADLNRFNARVVEAIRRADGVTPILLDGWFHGSVEGLAGLEPVDDPAVLYSFHFYEPWAFTTYRVNKGRYAYPDRMPAGDGDATVAWTEDDFAKRLQPAVDWAARHRIPASRIVAAEFGCDRRVAGARDYLAQLIAHLNARRWHWAFYSFRARDWGGLDYELGTEKLGWRYWEAREKGADHESLIQRRDNPLWEVFKRQLTPAE
jgi:hypothetical protein